MQLLEFGLNHFIFIFCLFFLFLFLYFPFPVFLEHLLGFSFDGPIFFEFLSISWHVSVCGCSNHCISHTNLPECVSTGVRIFQFEV